jgi:hypothetical protein
MFSQFWRLAQVVSHIIKQLMTGNKLDQFQEINLRLLLAIKLDTIRELLYQVHSKCAQIKQWWPQETQVKDLWFLLHQITSFAQRWSNGIFKKEASSRLKTSDIKKLAKSGQELTQKTTKDKLIFNTSQISIKNKKENGFPSSQMMSNSNLLCLIHTTKLPLSNQIKVLQRSHTS